MLISFIKDWQGLPKTLLTSFLFLFAFLIGVTNLRAEDGLTIQKVTLNPGETVAVPVNLNNEQTYTAFQLDIKLPEGVSVVQTEGTNGFSLTNRATSGHTMSTTTLKDGTIRVVVFSGQNEAFSGNTGNLLQFYLTMDSSFKGLKTIEVKNILFTTTTIKEVHFKDVSVACSKPSGKGDVNGDGSISITDAVAIVNYILGNPSSNFNESNADVNGDGNISITDAVAVVNLILQGAN